MLYRSPLETESLDDALHSRDEFVSQFTDPLASLKVRTFGSIEYKERKERCFHEGSTSKEQRS